MPRSSRCRPKNLERDHNDQCDPLAAVTPVHTRSSVLSLGRGLTPVLTHPALGTRAGRDTEELATWLGRLDTWILARLLRTDSLCLSTKPQVAYTLY